MPDESIVLHLTAVLNFTPAQFAAMLLRAEAEKHPAIVAALAADTPVADLSLEASAPHPPPEPPAEPVQPTEPPPPPETPPEPPPAAARAGRPARANGKAAPVKAVEPVPDPEPDPESEAPPEPLEEAQVRAVLRLFSTIMPGRDTAVVKLLQEVGGAPRLADCDRETWPAIVATAKQGIARHAQAGNGDDQVEMRRKLGISFLDQPGAAD